MRPHPRLPLFLAGFLLLAAGGYGQTTTQAPIDWERARELYRRERTGETLAPDDRQYLERAKEARQRGGTSSPPISQRKAPESLTPLCDMGAEARYEGEDGGLYGGGANRPRAPLQQSAEAALAKIRPLGPDGNPSPAGKIALVSISMSNATQEFSTFKRMADADPRKSPAVEIVDCAQGGQAMAEWVPPDGQPWQEAMRRLERAGVNPLQVQAAWIKLANKAPSGSMADHLAKLEADTAAVVENAARRFPNLRVVYLGSRIWAGNAAGPLNPEPYAYESAFAARHLILRQLERKPSSAADHAPVLVWGPYLWAEGEKGRKLDGLAYAPADFAEDGVHPSDRGREKVARLLLEFFAGDPLARGWFAGPQN